MTTPEDRGPSSERVVKFDRTNPIHQGLATKIGRSNNKNISVDARSHITMPVAPGMEEEPKRLTEEQVTELKNKTKGIKPKPKPVQRAAATYKKPVATKRPPAPPMKPQGPKRESNFEKAAKLANQIEDAKRKSI